MSFGHWFAFFLLALSWLFPQATCSAGDLADLRTRGVLRHLGIPYANFVTADGQGLDVEIVRGFANALGVRYELVQSDFVNVIRDLLGKNFTHKGNVVSLSGDFPIRGDMIAAGFTVLPWREPVLSFSAPTFPSQVLVVASAASRFKPIPAQPDLAAEITKTREHLAGHSLLVMERTCLDPVNYGLTNAKIDLRPYTASTNLSEMVPALLNGAADFTLLDIPDALIDLQRWAGRIRIIGPISETQDLAAAFPKSSPELRDAFDRFLRGIQADGTYDKLVNKYYPGVRHYFPEFFERQQ